MGKLSIPKLPTIKTKYGCVNSTYVIVLLIGVFILFRYYSFLPGRHYQDGHFLALINDEDVAVLHSMGYGLDQNNKQLYSKEGLPIFYEKDGNKKAISGYKPFNASSIIKKIQADVNKANSVPESELNKNNTNKATVKPTELPSETPSESPGESLDETEEPVN